MIKSQSCFVASNKANLCDPEELLSIIHLELCDLCLRYDRSMLSIDWLAEEHLGVSYRVDLPDLLLVLPLLNVCVLFHIVVKPKYEK